MIFPSESVLIAHPKSVLSTVTNPLLPKVASGVPVIVKTVVVVVEEVLVEPDVLVELTVLVVLTEVEV